ncbi:hypothetical protein NC652_041470 [Populus alba x Populus x berolinensis]|nr:hypothetical protein NC652_041470 [Populus alba x Populus x berolinensis]
MKNVFMMVWMVCSEDLHGPSAGSVDLATGILPCHLYSGESHDEGPRELMAEMLLDRFSRKTPMFLEEASVKKITWSELKSAIEKASVQRRSQKRGSFGSDL